MRPKLPLRVTIRPASEVAASIVSQARMLRNAVNRQCRGARAAGTRERYGGQEHGVGNLVEKTKLEVVCFRCELFRIDPVLQVAIAAPW